MKGLKELKLLVSNEAHNGGDGEIRAIAAVSSDPAIFAFLIPLSFCRRHDLIDYVYLGQ